MSFIHKTLKTTPKKNSKKNSSPKTKQDSPDPLCPEYCRKVCAAARITRRGFVVPKLALSAEDMKQIYSDLSLKPFVNSCGASLSAEAPLIRVFRENENKMYLPRFYGVARYGGAISEISSEISAGEPMSARCAFPGKLRDYQQPVVEIYLHHVGGAEGQGGAILEVPCAFGKTVMAIYIASALRRKTLVLVHKGFLMNQWIERIGQFMPGAAIGRIQGDIFDVDGCDIVLGMIQTMFKRDFGDRLAGFGLVIVDEVHRIGSEEFSKTLLGISARFMLGISATVDRKDQLTPLLYMFIGPRIFSQKDRDQGETVVLVRALRYASRGDADYDETLYDYKGDPQYSRMISKVCEYAPRRQFIADTLRTLRAIRPQSQILVLAHNICLLTFLYEACAAFATVGYYKGGMKREALQESEGKQIVLGTYAMASEGLDIPSLSTLVLATPKTDIIQCVGRILRAIDADTPPWIIDVMDTHTPFQNQWRKRRAYYVKCGYRVVYDLSSAAAAATAATAISSEDEDETNDCCQVLDE
jgi:superfamily II DNA or RNA helicase